jgi:antibiotic biosynthesis monooxygenase (ABM) superfamily enzyme
MNWPIYNQWDPQSRKCYRRFFIIYIILFIISIIAAFGLTTYPLNFQITIYLLIGTGIIVMIIAIYFLIKNPPISVTNL